MSKVYYFESQRFCGAAGGSYGGLFRTFSEVQKVIDILLWKEIILCADEAWEWVIVFNVFEDKEKVCTIDLLPCIVIDTAAGERFSLNSHGHIERAKRVYDEEDKYLEFGEIEINGERIRLHDFPSYARPWVDWSRVSWDSPSTDCNWEDVTDVPFGLIGFGAINADDIDRYLRCDPAWLAANDRQVVRTAKHIHESGNVSELPILADALEEAGCDNERFLWHLRLPKEAHALESWMVDFILEKGDEPSA